MNSSNKTVILPTVGRIVWYYPSYQDLSTAQGRSAALVGAMNKELAAIVTHVSEVNRINLLVIDAVGQQHPRLDVPLYQDCEPVPDRGGYASWMPYQVGQAAKQQFQDGPKGENPANR